MNLIQEKLLDLMIIVDEYLGKNDVEYSLAAGSLLGAVREGGFIPWDDDMDIVVKQTELQKIIDIKWPEYIKVVSYREGLFNLIKIIDTRFEYKSKGGDTPLFIDIFFFTKMQDSSYDQGRNSLIRLGNIVYDRRYFLKSKAMGSIFYRAIKKCIVAASIVIPKKIIGNKLKKQYEQKGEYWGTPNWDDHAYTQNWIFTSEQISKFTKVKFENKVELPVFANYEWHLETDYGKEWKTPIKVEANIHSFGQLRGTDKFKLPKNMKILNK